MSRSALVLSLVVAIFAQSCWAVVERLHAPGSHESAFAATTSDAAPKAADVHDQGPGQPSEHGQHHCCLCHGPFALPAHLASAVTAAGTFARPGHSPPSPDAPSEGIDRPNWRSPA